MEQASWQVPVFCCDELQTPHAMPMFLSRKALQEAWVVSGRKLSDLPQQAIKLPWLYFLLTVALLTTMDMLAVAILTTPCRSSQCWISACS